MSIRSEIAFASGLIAFCLFNYLYLIPSQVVAEGSSATYPNLMNFLLLAFALAYWTEGFLMYRKENLKGVRQEKKSGNFWALYWRPLVLLVIIAAWILTLGFAGFLLSTFIFLVFSSMLFGATNILRVLILSIVMPLLVFTLFYWVNAPLPAGPIETMIVAAIR